MNGVLASQIELARSLRASNLTDTCQITPKLPPGQTPVPVTVKCAASLPASPFRGGVGERIGYGGGAPPMERSNDLQFSFPYGTEIEPNARIDWIDRGRAYTAGQKRFEISFDCDVTVLVVEIPS